MSARTGRGAGQPLRIAQVAPPLEAVPPIGYGGTERIVGELVRELDRRGHQVTTFASGDSRVPGRHVETVPLALRPIGFGDDPTSSFRRTVELVLEQQEDFDLIHAHLDPWNLELARRARIPVVSTFHGRLDQSWAGDAFRDGVRGLVAISRDQARVHPEADWTVIYHGVTFRPPPLPEASGEDFCFVGRMSPEKGFPDAIEIARLTGRRLLVAAKIPTRQIEIDYYDAIIRPALDRADVTILGELSEADRDRLVASSRASLVPSAWPEPFGLVVIEALACGTPVLARRAGAIPEILRDGIDGFIGDDAQQLAFLDGRLDELDRGAIQAAALERFAVGRMVDAYEALYRRLLDA
ncbi:MAG: glycosyltransferase family 4 protein [Candidatus Limnocylindrales bacterium]|nr:glycosyltransferase family 4 protein [Candidatus Limnocylindrales bacterium]